MHYSCINLCDLLYRAIKNENYRKTELQSKELERLYLGSYFCGNYFLGIMEGAIKKILEDCNQSVVISLVIPVFSEGQLIKGKEKIKTLLNYFPNKIDEVVVNDYGMLEYISENYDLPIVLGRLFMKEIGRAHV